MPSSAKDFMFAEDLDRGYGSNSRTSNGVGLFQMQRILVVEIPRALQIYMSTRKKERIPKTFRTVVFVMFFGGINVHAEMTNTKTQGKTERTEEEKNRQGR
jgi:hypothetical protein